MTATLPNTPEKPLRRPSLLRRAVDNPVILKELRGLMRGRRAFLLLTGYIAIISLFTSLAYLFAQTEAAFILQDPQLRQTTGKSIFGTIVLLELTLITFIAPALTSGAITAERERQTFDLLRTTLLSARSLVFGKLGSALIYLFMLILAGLPIQSLTFLLGGVGLTELIISSWLLVVTALFFSALGLFFSSFLRRTLAATVSSYATIVFSYLMLGTIILPLMVLSGQSINNNPLLEVGAILIAWGLLSTNPMLTAIMSEVILIEDQSLLYTTSASPSNLPFLISPWILFTGIYLTATLLLILISIYLVSRRDRT